MLPMVPLFGGNEGDVVFALLGKLLRIEDDGTSISASTLLLLKKKNQITEIFFWSSEIRLRTGKCNQVRAFSHLVIYFILHPSRVVGRTKAVILTLCEKHSFFQ